MEGLVLINLENILASTTLMRYVSNVKQGNTSDVSKKPSNVNHVSVSIV